MPEGIGSRRRAGRAGRAQGDASGGPRRLRGGLRLASQLRAVRHAVARHLAEARRGAHTDGRGAGTAAAQTPRRQAVQGRPCRASPAHPPPSAPCGGVPGGREQTDR